ncbi:MAG: hypothetical protein TREMPRED_002388 [Tremellales sp. Tagirdzhanova-0007]|nr:MAG: hypothetical protein TREMPRED_002388 [Tremellales sp. Tagirdzhanova-0007]
MTAFLNTYKPTDAERPQEDLRLETPPEEYDFNYVFEVKTLRSDRVELRPYVRFEPSSHALSLWEGVQVNPEILRWLGTKPWRNLNDVLVWSETTCRAPSDSLFYAIFTDKPGSDTGPTDAKDYVFAGVIGMIASSQRDLMSEPGWILIMKPFQSVDRQGLITQRTHVLTHAAGLVMRRILDMPEQGGLGLRRCQWKTTSLNLPSQNAAKRLGYTPEGVLRAAQVLDLGKEGIRPGRKGDAQEEGMSRDNWYASVIWEEWQAGVREHVDELMARRP